MKKQTNLRFAALRRVSTERQKKVGESLLTQKKQIEKYVEQHGGKIIEWYGGQEHATPGYEKTEIKRLLEDAKRKKFNAIIVTHADRWSRDNETSKRGLKIFKQNKIRYFEGPTEHDLYNPASLFYLGMTAEVGQFQANSQNRKSIENRIERAKGGVPTGGKLPFGRTYDKKAKKWDIDKKKKAMIEEAARRYLSGEQMPRLAEEYEINHSTLHKILTKRSGDKWKLKFNSDDFDIHEEVELKIPRLLSEKTIKAIRKKVEANKTYAHGEIKYKYLLARMIFCKHCGYAMSGQANSKGILYYRHAHSKRVKECNCPKSQIRADELEEMVMLHLFDCFGNPLVVQKAMEDAIPNLKKLEEHRNRLEHIKDELAKVERSQKKFFNLIKKDAIAEVEVEEELNDLKIKKQNLLSEFENLNGALEKSPTPEKIKEMSEKVSKKLNRSVEQGSVRRRASAKPYKKMTYEEKRALLELVFSGKMVDGRRMGVYIEWEAPKKWKFDIHGHLINLEGLILMSESRKNIRFDFDESGYGHKQKELVTKYASH